MGKNAEANRLTERYIPMAVSMAEKFSAPVRNEAIRRDWVQQACITTMMVVRAYLYGREPSQTLQTVIYRQVRQDLVRMSHAHAKYLSIVTPLDKLLGYLGDEEDKRFSTVPRPVSLNPEPGEMAPRSVEALGQVQMMAFEQCNESHPDHDAYMEECLLFREFTNDLSGRFAALQERRRQRAIEQSA